MSTQSFFSTLWAVFSPHSLLDVNDSFSLGPYDLLFVLTPPGFFKFNLDKFFDRSFPASESQWPVQRLFFICGVTVQNALNVVLKIYESYFHSEQKNRDPICYCSSTKAH